MRDVKIALSIVNFISIVSCSVTKSFNEHGHGVIGGFIKPEDEEGLLHGKGADRFAKIQLFGEDGEEEILFTGVVESVKIQTEAHLKKAFVTLVGATKLLECVERTRTFQDSAMTYEQILKSVDQNYSDIQHILHEGDKKAIGDLLVQYKETDWQFIKRIASHFHTGVVPYYKTTGIRYFVGLPVEEVRVLQEKTSFSIKNNRNEYDTKRENQVADLMPQDAYYYEVESREFHDLGDCIQFQQTIFYVYSVQSTLRGGELLHTYQLKYKGGFKLEKTYNNKIIGASLDGRILASSRDRVKTVLSVDGAQDKATAKWFPYSTVYSSPDGSGWYCMPEEKDRVRLYFPSEREEEAYIISSIHSDTGSTGASGGEAPRSNPDNKSISTKHKKQVELTPTSIIITNNKGMTIKLDDEEGISIVSDKDVMIQSDELLSVKSVNESMSVEAVESIELIQGSTKITMKEDVVIEGAKFKVQ